MPLRRAASLTRSTPWHGARRLGETVRVERRRRTFIRAEYQFQVSSFKFQVSSCKLQADVGFHWKLETGNSKLFQTDYWPLLVMSTTSELVRPRATASLLFFQS